MKKTIGRRFALLLLLLSGFISQAQTPDALKNAVDSRLQIGLRYPAPRVQDYAAAMHELIDWSVIVAAGKLDKADSAKFLRSGYLYADPIWLQLSKGKVGLGLVDNTADADKPISTATATALAGKAALSSPTFTGTVSGITKTMVGLGNVDNTSDAAKPVSTATATALAAKAALSSPTFTGTVSGITKTMVGLGNVDNTSDAAKPVSTATATALADKVSLTASYANPAWITDLPFSKITGTASTAQLGSGTPAAGKYVDGASGAWTALPVSASLSAANTWTARQTFSAGLDVTGDFYRLAGSPILTNSGGIIYHYGGGGGHIFTAAFGGAIIGSMKSGGNWLIGPSTTDTGRKLQVQGDAEITTNGGGLILKATDGVSYKVTVSTAGALVVTVQ